MALPRPFDSATLVCVYWQLRLKADGRVLLCGLFDTVEGKALMAGYVNEWLWRSHLGNPLQSEATAELWRRTLLNTGHFEDVDRIGATT